MKNTLPTIAPDGFEQEHWDRVRADMEAFVRSGMPEDMAEAEALLVRLCSIDPRVGYFARAVMGHCTYVNDELDDYYQDGLWQWRAIGLLVVFQLAVVVFLATR